MTRIARIFTDRFWKRFKGREGRKEECKKPLPQICAEHADYGNYQKGNKTLPRMTWIFTEET
jgi:hypothetical protein